MHCIAVFHIQMSRCNQTCWTITMGANLPLLWVCVCFFVSFTNNMSVNSYDVWYLFTCFNVYVWLVPYTVIKFSIIPSNWPFPYRSFCLWNLIPCDCWSFWRIIVYMWTSTLNVRDRIWLPRSAFKGTTANERDHRRGITFIFKENHFSRIARRGFFEWRLLCLDSSWPKWI